jgi:hypothetical protein
MVLVWAKVCHSLLSFYRSNDHVADLSIMNEVAILQMWEMTEEHSDMTRQGRASRSADACLSSLLSSTEICPTEIGKCSLTVAPLCCCAVLVIQLYLLNSVVLVFMESKRESPQQTQGRVHGRTQESETSRRQSTLTSPFETKRSVWSKRSVGRS